MNAFSQRIKECRLSKGLTQRQAAENFNIVERHWRAYELGTRTPTFEKLIELANFFNVSIDWLVGRSEEKALR
ncbi:MAG: helix-turn-helix transcriptional regulator [Pyramidobacter sp.]|nr:helix-turn-helix transcriptional regulator [Pyramidobacter sp.]